MMISKSGDSVTFRYTHDHRQIRRVVSVAELTEFLEGGRREESNLPDGQLPVKFGEFAVEKYLVRCAKPSLKSNSYDREEDAAKSRLHVFAAEYLHKVDLDSWENYKTGRLNGTLPFSTTRCANSTVDKEFDCLRRILNYGVQLGQIKRNPLLGVKGLKIKSRREIWLHTLKKRSDSVVKRYFEIASLGPRFAALLSRLRPLPRTGLYFYGRDGNAYAIDSIDGAFAKVRRAANLEHVRPYDLRGTFAMHRAIVVKNFRQLQSEMGHSNPMSIQSYLDEAGRFRREDSIFSEIPAIANQP